jgi:uncharacterized protein YjbI with pentapeptide repeats
MFNNWRLKRNQEKISKGEKKLRYAYLKKAYLKGSDLRNFDLRGANLRGADLRMAKLDNADLSGADLREANLAASSLCGTNLKGANLRYANIEGVCVYNTNLERTDLRNTIHYDMSSIWRWIKYAAEEHAKISDDDLSKLEYYLIKEKKERADFDESYKKGKTSRFQPSRADDEYIPGIP